MRQNAVLSSEQNTDCLAIPLFNDPVLRDNLHLKTCHLVLDGDLLSFHEVLESGPFALNVIDVQPRWRKLETMFFQKFLSFPVHIDLKNKLHALHVMITIM